MTTVIEDLRRSIQRQLDDLEEQRNYQLFLEGFGPSEGDQREQATRDFENLKRRLQELPGELELELEAIDRRFSVTRTTLFPAAVTWLVPQGAIL